MRIIITILAMLPLLAIDLRAQTADDFVTAGRLALAAQNLPGANSNFNRAVSIDVSNAPANLLLAGTRLLLLPQNPAVSQALTAVGVPTAGRNIYNWTAELPKDSNGHTIIPSSLNSSQAITLYSNSVMPALAACQTNLARITDQSFMVSLLASETDGQDVTIDYGDVQVLRALLAAAQVFGHGINSENLSVVITHIRDLGNSDQLSIQRVLSDYPNLLKLTSKSELAASLPPLVNAINYYLGASDFLETVRPPGADRLFTLSTNDMDKEMTFRTNAMLALESLDHPVNIDVQGESHSVFLGAFFTGSNSVRSFIPAFNGNRYVYNSMPDYGFGGLLLDTPSIEIEQTARKILGRPAPGIYMASISGYNWMDGFDFNGAACAFVRTNGLVTFISVYTNADMKGSFVEQPAILKTEIQFDTNGVNGTVGFTKSGDLWGNLNDDSNNWYASIDGFVFNPPGDFQDQAGYYAGTYSGSQSGQLRAVLSPDGQFILMPFNGSKPSGGGAGQFDGSDTVDFFGGGGSEIQGTLSRNLHQITGTYDNQSDNPPTHGTFTLTRSIQLPSDAPPFLTGVLGSTTTATTDSDVTLTVSVGGSPPFSYQWYSNGVPINLATGPSLVLHAVDDSFMAGYSVVVGNLTDQQTNDATALIVVPENVPPTIAITSPIANQKLSNDVAVVTGTANDNAAVTNVSCRINGGDWTDAAGTADWSVSLPLVAGTNILEAFAADSSGNLSSTGKVTFVRVAVDLLTVQITGLGTLTPNYSNKVLVVGSPYTMKATAGAGYVFSNWVNATTLVTLSNGPALSFTMESNLVLQANFVLNPFGVPSGVFNGLFSTSEPRAQDKSGFFTLTLKNTGLGSGSLKIGTKAYSFTSKFDLAGFASNSVTHGTNPLTLMMNLNLPKGDTITGTISQGSAWTADLKAYRAITTPASTFTNKYTLDIRGTNGDDTLPEGDGSGAAAVSLTGKLAFKGTLADATPFNQTVVISKDGDWPFYAPANNGLGSVYGWMKIINTNPPEPAYVGGIVNWIKPAQATSKAYPNGFNFTSMALGEAWSPPAPGTRAVDFSNSIVVFEESGIIDFTNDVYLTLNNKITNASLNKLTFTLTPASGLFKGSVTVPGTSQSFLFNGALLQDDNVGLGSFVNSNRTGRVLFGLPETLFPPVGP